MCNIACQLCFSWMSTEFVKWFQPDFQLRASGIQGFNKLKADWPRTLGGIVTLVIKYWAISKYSTKDAVHWILDVIISKRWNPRYLSAKIKCNLSSAQFGVETVVQSSHQGFCTKNIETSNKYCLKILNSSEKASCSRPGSIVWPVFSLTYAQVF